MIYKWTAFVLLFIFSTAQLAPDFFPKHPSTRATLASKILVTERQVGTAVLLSQIESPAEFYLVRGFAEALGVPPVKAYRRLAFFLMFLKRSPDVSPGVNRVPKNSFSGLDMVEWAGYGNQTPSPLCISM